MKVVILAGGFGTRLFEETISRPKPMINIGGMPILWHLMKFYKANGFNEFIICMGYKKEVIIKYFKQNYVLKKQVILTQNPVFEFFDTAENIKVTLVDTGLNSMTGGRLKKIKHLINDESFLLSYGDTLSNINIREVIKLHRKKNVQITLSSVNPKSNYGLINFDGSSNIIKKFVEKPIMKNNWVNGGFYVVDSKILDLIKGDNTSLEENILPKLVKNKAIAAYKHRGFWKSIETYKDKLEMEEVWLSNNADWNIWEHKLGNVL